MSDSPENLTTNPVAKECRRRAENCTTYMEAHRAAEWSAAADEIDRLTAEVAELRLSADANLYAAQQHMLKQAVLASEVAELRRVLQVALRAPGIHTTDQVTGEVFSAVIGTALGEQP